MQNQQRIEWPRSLVVAKAYLDQLERSQALPAEQISAVRQAIQSSETAKLKELAGTLEKSTMKNAADVNRLQGLVEILKDPAR